MPVLNVTSGKLCAMSILPQLKKKKQRTEGAHPRCPTSYGSATFGLTSWLGEGQGVNLQEEQKWGFRPCPLKAQLSQGAAPVLLTRRHGSPASSSQWRSGCSTRSALMHESTFFSSGGSPEFLPRGGRKPGLHTKLPGPDVRRMERQK